MSKHSSDSIYDSASSDHAQMIRLLDESREMREKDASVAVELSEKALAIAIQLGDREHEYESGYVLGRCLNMQGELEKALDVLSHTLHIARKYFSHDKKKLAATTNAVGIVYYSMDNRELALDYFLKALQFDIREENLKINNNLANIYAANEDYKAALKYFDAALLDARVEEDYYMITALLLNSSKSLMVLGDLKKAKNNCLDALVLSDKNSNNDDRFIHLKNHILLGLTDVSIAEGKYDKALEFVNEALEMAEKRSSHVTYCMALNLKSLAFLEMDEEETAIMYANQTLEYSEKYKLDKERKFLLNSVIEFYEKKEDYAKAYPYLKKLQVQTKKEEIQSREKNFKKILTDREQEIELLADKNREIKEHNMLLEQFAHIISHDLKEPIRNIVSFSSLLNKRYYHLLDEGGREFLKYIIKGATTMNQNLIRLLEFTTLKRVNYEEIQNINLSKIVNRLEGDYKGVIEPFEVNISYPDTSFQMIYEHVFALFDELVGNAVKFRKNGMNCYIDINMTIEKGNYHFSIKDYGIGIEREYQKKIFRIYNRLNKRDYSGSGVGLAICERIIKLYQGEIWIESELGVYTTVHFTIPTMYKNNMVKI